MADAPAPEGTEGKKPADAAAAAPASGAITRPDSIPETFWDTDKNSAKFDDIGAALTERETLKTAADARAKLIPAKPDDYKFDLPEGFKMPDGYQWSADAKEPLVAGFRTLAAELSLTQPEVQKLVAFEATRQANEITGRKAFEAEQTKALGANADQRRQAAGDWIDAKVTDPGRAKVLKTMLTYAQGVEAIEDLISNANVGTRGNAGDSKEGDAKTAALIDNIGKPGGAMKLLRARN